MPYITKAEKLLALAWVHRYIHAGNKLSIKQYERFSVWANGDTYAEIAEAEGVTHQAVAASVHKTVNAILEFAKANDKDYNNSLTTIKRTQQI